MKEEGKTLLATIGQALVSIFITAGSLLGFVAFAGAVIVWTRFFAVKVPPDQAVKVVPQSELVATGSSVLLLFGFFGVLAVVATYLVDRGARATPNMSRALLIFLAIEGVVAVTLAGGASMVDKSLVAAVLVGLVAVALALTFARSLVHFRDVHPSRPGERLPPTQDAGLLHDGRGAWRVRPRELWAIAGLLVVVVVAILVPLLVDLSGLPLAALWVHDGAVAVAAAYVAVRMAMPIWQGIRFERWQMEALHEDVRRRRPAALREEPWSRRPFRPYFSIAALLMMMGLAAIGIAVPALVLHEFWLAVPLAAAVVLSFGLWRIACLSKRSFMWFGLAVFLSVPLFGTLALMARNLANPQVQPMALIRKTDGPNEAIQGIYVTEASDRVYFATLETEGCGDKLRPASGRLEWVPKSEVVAMSIGPTQSIESAGLRALEMAYALTPAVETGSGVEEAPVLKGGKAEKVKAAAPVLDKRLERTGPAIRPNFGNGLTLSPESASPGKVVTLRMSAPNKDVEGFGMTRSGRALRVGGVRANIVKEPARSVEGAEYLRAKGQFLRLAKHEPYEKSGDGYAPAEAESEGEGERHPFVKLIDRRVLKVGAQEMTKAGIYLKLAPGHRSPRLAHKEVAILRARGRAGALGETEEVTLGAQPLGQAWHEREIKFEVPETAESGAVSVECSQLAGQPLLRVSHAPEARVWVRVHGGSNRVSFNSRRSTDADEEPIIRRWNVAGLRRGDLPQVSAGLAPRAGAYTVRLTATDQGGAQDTAVVRVLRLPASLFRLDKPRPRGGALGPERLALARAMRREPPSSIEIEGYASDTGVPNKDANLSLRRAEDIDHALLRKRLKDVAGGGDIAVRMVGFGDGCPGRGSLQNHRVDVFLLSEGATMAAPDGCRPRRLKLGQWHLLPAEDCAAPAPTPPPPRGFPAQFRALIRGFLEYLSGREASSVCAAAPPPR